MCHHLSEEPENNAILPGRLDVPLHWGPPGAGAVSRAVFRPPRAVGSGKQDSPQSTPPGLQVPARVPTTALPVVPCAMQVYFYFDSATILARFVLCRS